MVSWRQETTTTWIFIRINNHSGADCKPRRSEEEELQRLPAVNTSQTSPQTLNSAWGTHCKAGNKRLQFQQNRSCSSVLLWMITHHRHDNKTIQCNETVKSFQKWNRTHSASSSSSSSLQANELHFSLSQLTNVIKSSSDVTYEPEHTCVHVSGLLFKATQRFRDGLILTINRGTKPTENIMLQVNNLAPTHR